MYTNFGSAIRLSAMTGLVVAGLAAGLLAGTAHAGPLDDGAANVTSMSDAGGSHEPVTCSFDGVVYQAGETRTTDGVSFYCMPNGVWVTIDPPGPPQQTKSPRQLKGVVSLMK